MWRYPYRCQITNFSAVCETAGRFAHIYALADTAHAAPVVPIITACCAALVLWNRLFLKEKLSRKHCAMILPVAAVS